VELLKAQNDEGLRLLKQRYTGLIHYIVAGILPDRDDTDECINDIYMKIWTAAGSYTPGKSKFTTWLTVISRNTALDYLKHRQRTYAELGKGFADRTSPEEVVLCREKERELKGAVAALTSEEQHIFYRKYYYLQRTAQIAAELGMTERSVEGKLYRLRKKLQRALGGGFR